MTDRKELIRNMLDNFINDNTAQSSVDLKDVIVQTIRDQTGINVHDVSDTSNADDDIEELERQVRLNYEAAVGNKGGDDSDSDSDSDSDDDD